MLIISTLPAGSALAGHPLPYLPSRMSCLPSPKNVLKAAKNLCYGNTAKCLNVAHG
jgi:hypothetical protein